MWKRIGISQILWISRRKRCWWCFPLSSGIRILILYGVVATILQFFWVLYRLLSLGTKGEGLFENRTIECSYSTLGFGYDVIWNIYKGEVNTFTAIYSIVTSISSAATVAAGVYAWFKKFNLKVTEKYLYIHFISTIFYLVNFIMMNIITSPEWVPLVPSSIMATYVVACLNNLLYSFTIQVDREYRLHRKHFSDKKYSSKKEYFKLNEISVSDY